MTGIFHIFIYVLLPYAGAFALLAILSRWRWLLPAAVAAAVLCIWAGKKVAMPEAPYGPDVSVMVVIAAGFGFTSGFIARALILSAQAYGWRWARPKLILPITFVAAPFVLVGLIKII